MKARADVPYDGQVVRGEAEVSEIDVLEDVTRQVEGHAICALAMQQHG